MKKFLIIIPFLFACLAHAQTAADNKFSALMPSSNMPPELIEGKTVVLIEMPGKSPEELKRISEAFHSEIIKAGIDAVAYYEFFQIYAGFDITESYMSDFQSREIQNLILMQYKGEDSRVAVLKMNGDFLIKNSPDSAWIFQGDFKSLVRQTYLKTAGSGLERKNFLINRLPESGIFTKPIKGRRADFFSINLKNGKLAIPKTGNSSRDEQLLSIIKSIYPWEFELTDQFLTDDELESAGFRFVLRSVGGPIEMVREYLDYEIEQEASAYISMHTKNGKSDARPISKKSNAWKFYIKELNSQTIYLGTEWDADINYIEAMISHFNSIINNLNR